MRVQDPRIQNEGSWNSYVDYKIFLHVSMKMNQQQKCLATAFVGDKRFSFRLKFWTKKHKHLKRTRTVLGHHKVFFPHFNCSSDYSADNR